MLVPRGHSSISRHDALVLLTTVTAGGSYAATAGTAAPSGRTGSVAAAAAEGWGSVIITAHPVAVLITTGTIRPRLLRSPADLVRSTPLAA